MMAMRALIPSDTWSILDLFEVWHDFERQCRHSLKAGMDDLHSYDSKKAT